MKIRIKILVPFFMIAVSIFSCSPPSQTEKELRETINKPIHLEMFETLRHTNNLLSFNELRQQYDYLSVVYLQNGCQPCYPKFIEWQQMADSLNYPDNYSVLFVIQGNSYEGFMNEVLNIDYVEDRYYTIMDPEFKFLEANKDIPRWIIDASVLIDAENKIKMVGAPWLNEDMTQLFYACANSQAGDTEGAEAARLSHLAPSTTEVGVVQVVRGDFELELISNGTLEEQRRAVVPFAVQEQILSVSVRHHFQSAC